MKYSTLITNIDFNLDFFKSLFDDIITDEWREAKGKYALRLADANTVAVQDHAVLQNIKKQIPKLADYIKLIKVGANTSLPAHKDLNRLASINIPVLNGSVESVTNFLENATETKWIKDGASVTEGVADTEYAMSNDYVQYFVDGKIVESYSLIDTPILINTTIVHEVINKSNIARYAWIWSYNDTYENAKAQLLNG